MCGAGMAKPPAALGDLQVVPSESEELPLPVAMAIGRPGKAEDWREEASSHSRSTTEGRQNTISGVFCMQLKATLRIGTVVVGSWLILTILENEWDERTVLMVGCSIIPGLAGMYLCSRASTKHSLSTAGFLLCTWILGLVQTDGIQDMEMIYEGRGRAQWRTSLLANELLHPVQDVLLILLSVQRLSSLQSSAGHAFIPHLMKLFCSVGTVYTAGQVLNLSMVWTHAEWEDYAQVCAILLYASAVWLCVKILFAYQQVLESLHSARVVAERTCFTEIIKDSGCQALKRARWAMRKETWGMALCFTSTLVSFPFANMLIRYGLHGCLPWILSAVLLGNTLGTWILSNAQRQPRTMAETKSTRCLGRKTSRTLPRTEAPPEWQAKVKQLSMRGITAQALLSFYKSLGGRLMPHYQAGQHTTSDVVRQAIIPHTRHGRCAYATFIHGPRRPDRMVTHSWRNLFRDLVAAVIADAVGESSFGLVAALLEEDVSVLEALLQQQGTADRVYWICAFAVNQHAGICENHDGDRDSVTGQVHPGCTCGLPKMLNTTAPLSTEGPTKGQSIGCEMNKFDDMMALLARKDPHFSQVVAVDAGFVLFRRAWCVAELVEADEARLRQHVKMHSRKAVEDMASSLRNLRVESMEASRAQDVEFILERIEDTSLFNQKLQSLIFDKTGLLSCWRRLDAAHRMEEVGSLLKWSFADNGRGIVWQFWHLRD
mmetsp:Transcript_28826/g.67887  ORF Transcript_28826/g.67887 Transcript_28826/m.67887 type:complete len:716 (-) Transcript_28826:42-2189(-)